MHHYLDASGAPLELDSGIFRNNARVQDQMRRLRDPIRKTRRACQSGRFYMPHPSSPDSVFGLYWGTLQGTPHLDDAGRVHIRWRAEVPWEWPTYESLRRRYGTPHAETFLLPNARSIAAGSRYALHIENGLGGYLVTAGLARSFLAWSEWEE